MRVLVTGAGGYLGSAAVPLLKAGGATVIAVTRDGRAVPGARSTVGANLADRAAVERLISNERPTAILHLAAYLPGVADSAPDIESHSRRDNRDATIVLAEAARGAEVDRFVFASTISVYPENPADGVAHSEDDPLKPRGVYGNDKAASEECIARLWADKAEGGAVILRLAGIHGPPRRSGAIHNFCRAAIANKPLMVEAPDSTFSFIFCDDAAAACRSALMAPLPKGADIFNIGGETATLLSISRRILRLSGSESHIELGTAPARRQGMRIGKARTGLDFVPGDLDRHLEACLAFARSEAAR